MMLLLAAAKLFVVVGICRDRTLVLTRLKLVANIIIAIDFVINVILFLLLYDMIISMLVLFFDLQSYLGRESSNWESFVEFLYWHQ